MSILDRKNVDSLVGKVLVCKTRNYDYNFGRQQREWAPGDLVLVLAHEKSPNGASWKNARESVKFFIDGSQGEIHIDYAFDINWGIIEPEEILGGKGFVFTGALANTREYYKKVVEMFGGVFQSSVTKKTNYLVMADKRSQSTKAQKARANGIILLDEVEFLELIRNGG